MRARCGWPARRGRIADWNFPELRARMRPQAPLHALAGYAHLLDAARAAGLIDARGHARLVEFRQDPAAYSWPADPGPGHRL
jgi:hypothetical protein